MREPQGWSWQERGRISFTTTKQGVSGVVGASDHPPGSTIRRADSVERPAR